MLKLAVFLIFRFEHVGEYFNFSSQNTWGSFHTFGCLKGELRYFGAFKARAPTLPVVQSEKNTFWTIKMRAPTLLVV